jgi:broad specificity phosphatase PhoE
MRGTLRVIAGVVFATLVAAAATAQSSTLVFLVRHAEKAATPADDPPLTPAGDARARALMDALEHASIDAIISTPYVRTRSTAAPIASQRGLTIETVAVAGGVAAHAQAVAAAVRRHAGKAVLVVGHSNTINAIAAALGGPRLPDLCDEHYDQLFVLELSSTGEPRFARAHYGTPTPRGECSQMQGRQQAR